MNFKIVKIGKLKDQNPTKLRFFFYEIRKHYGGKFSSENLVGTWKKMTNYGGVDELDPYLREGAYSRWGGR